MKSSTEVVATTSVAFLSYYVLNEFAFRPLCESLDQVGLPAAISYAVAYLVVGAPIFLAAWRLHKSGVLRALGIDRGFLGGIVFAAFCTLPMLIGYAVVFEWNQTLGWNRVVTGALLAAFFEELYFRDFLFGQLYRFTRIGFVPAVAAGALLFAASHLHQSTDPATLVGVFLTTLMGAVFFAWLYVEWDNNLWVPIGMHALMNLVWLLFSAGENALGGWYANAFRAMTSAAAIVGTVRFKKSRGLKREVVRGTLWMKPKRSGPDGN